VENFWDTVYPRFDPADDNNPFERVNILEALNDWDLVLAPLMKAPLCSSRSAGSVNLRQYRIAAGKASELLVSDEEQSSAFNLAGIEAAFTDCSMELLRSTSHNASGSLAEVRRLRDLMNEKVGSNRAPDLEKFIQILGEIESLVQGQLSRRDPAAIAALESSDEKPGGPDMYEQATASKVRGFDRIENREDVRKLLGEICTYYELFEPTSPVPYLLKRAMRLVDKNFMEIIEDLAPDSLAQVTAVCGPREQQE
jgi:type VI secretion system protein ImpA